MTALVFLLFIAMIPIDCKPYTFQYKNASTPEDILVDNLIPNSVHYS